MDEAEFGVDDISEEEYNRLKEESMAKKKKKKAKTLQPLKKVQPIEESKSKDKDKEIETQPLTQRTNHQDSTS